MAPHNSALLFGGINHHSMTTDIVPIETKKNVLNVQQLANSLSVTSPDEAVKASEVLHNIKEATRQLIEKKSEITRPQMQALANVKALFAPLELALKDADKMVRAKVIAYEIEKAEKIETAKAKIAARAEKGTIRPETAVKKLGEVGEVSKTEGLRVQTRRKLQIVDETLLPREYLVPDRDKITKALFAGIDVFGAVLVEEKILQVVE